MLSVKNNVDNEVEVLKTFDLMRDVVLAIHGHIQYVEQGRVIESETLNPKYLVDVITPVDSIFETVVMNLRTLENGQVEIKGEVLNSDFSLNAPLNELVAIPKLGYVRLQNNPDYFSPSDNITEERKLKIIVRPLNSVTESYRDNLTV